jgi:hypothetical protein
MLITCPHCGPRDVSEFTYQGDGNRVRPDPMSQDIAAWNNTSTTASTSPAIKMRSGNTPEVAARIWSLSATR